MIFVAIFFTVLAIIAIWRVARADLAAKPWLEQGVIGDLSDPETRQTPAARTALRVFLAVLGSLFALLASAYAMRMTEPDWRSAPMPPILWLNTGVLILSSLALQASVYAAQRGEARRARRRLLAGAGFAMAFLVGQLVAWRQFADAGFFLSTNPSSSFFYLLTGLHGAHLAGGLVALGWTVARGQGAVSARSGIELCALYWHFLLFVWLIFLALLTGWVGGFVSLCRSVAG